MDWSVVETARRYENIALRVHGATLVGREMTGGHIDPYPSTLPNMTQRQILQHHAGCVNTIHWNADGSTLITGSDDRQVGIWRPNELDDWILRASCHSGHSHNIFDAKFVPGWKDDWVVTCAADGELRHFPVEPNPPAYIVNHKSLAEQGARPQMMYHVEFLRQDPMSLLACCQDGTLTQYDLRVRTFYNKLYTTSEEGHRSRMGVTTFCLHPLDDYAYLVAGGDLYARLFDLRKPRSCIRRYKPDDLARSKSKSNSSITGLSFSPSGEEFAMSVTNHAVYIVKTNVARNKMQGKETDTTTHSYDMILAGHRNIDTFLKGVTYLGPDHMSTGSDCGYAFVWDRHSGRVVNILHGDERVVNMVSPHPFRPLIAVCGIDSEAKLFKPGAVMDLPSSRERYSRKVKIDTLLEANLQNLEDAPHYHDFLSSALTHLRAVVEADGCDKYPTYPRDLPGLTPVQALDISTEIKARGNELFRESSIQEAVEKYTKALAYVEFATRGMIETKEVRIAIMSNAALCLIKLRKYTQATKYCTMVLGLDPRHSKCLYRRALCAKHKGDLEGARADVTAALQLVPADADCQALRDEIEELTKKKGARDKGNFSKMFD